MMLFGQSVVRIALVVVASSTLALLVACSSDSSSESSSSSGASTSSSGSGETNHGGVEKAKTCKNTTSRIYGTATSCNTCDQTRCASELDAVYGSDPNVFGGACGDAANCQCDCSASDMTCLSACTLSQACVQAFGALGRCQESKCESECRLDGG